MIAWMTCARCRHASFNKDKTQFRCIRTFYTMINPICFLRAIAGAAHNSLRALVDLVEIFKSIAEAQKKIMKKLEDDLGEGDSWKK